jgi:glycosyl transferase family 87
MTDAPRGSSVRLLVRAPAIVFLVLVAIRLAIVGHTIAEVSGKPVTDVYVLRVEEIASSPGTPYRDFPVEYLFPENLAMQLIGGSGAEATSIRLVFIAFVADLAAAAAVWWGWGRRPAAIYLVLGVPLLSFLYQRFDLVSVALAIWGVALVERREDDLGGGIAIGSAVMLKLWPLAVAPLMLVRRRWRALRAAAAVCLVIGLAWLLAAGAKGPVQVLSFRGARGWSAESIEGNLLWLVSRGTPILEQGAMRIGAAPASAKGLLFVGLLGYEVVVWHRASGGARDPAGAACLAAVTAVLVFSPLISEQYAAWLLPWAAVAFEGDRAERKVAAIAASAIVLTGLLGLFYIMPYGWAPLAQRWTILARNVALVLVLIVWFRATAPIASKSAIVAGDGVDARFPSGGGEGI